jgi:DNA ligase D-like protein (predicted ligase)
VHPLLEALDDGRKALLVRKKQPAWVEPMLATLTERRFSDSNWVFEQKFDGERCMVFREKGSVLLLSRNKKSLNDTYPELESAFLDAGDERFIADGEVVAFKGEVTSFSRLQERMQVSDRKVAERSSVAVYLYLFDLVYLDCCDLCDLDLCTRKDLLEHLIAFKDPLRFTTHRNEDGVAYWKEACAKGWEGVIAKRADSRYLHRRSNDWLKFKCINQQEFVIGGYSDPRGGRQGFGALLLGYYRGGDLIYAGKVGTGFDDKSLQIIAGRLMSQEQEASPFADKKRPERGEHFVSPGLVCEVAFTEWTPDGKLRHPRFLGLRDDKPPGDVIREQPQ